MSSASVLLSLFADASASVLLSVVLASGGAYLVFSNVVSESFAETMARVQFYIVIPSFLFMRISETFDLGRVAEQWPVIVCQGVYVTVGMLVVPLFVRLCVRPPKKLRSLLVASIIFNNAGNLPLVIVLATMTSEIFSVYGLTIPELEKLAKGYISLVTILGAILPWVVGYMLMSPPAAPSAATSYAQLQEGADGAGAPHGPAPSTFRTKVLPILKLFIKPPTLSSLIGVFVGMIGPLKRLTTQPPLPLRPLMSALYITGDSFVLVAMLSLGGALAVTFRTQWRARRRRREQEQRDHALSSPPPSVVERDVEMVAMDGESPDNQPPPTPKGRHLAGGESPEEEQRQHAEPPAAAPPPAQNDGRGLRVKFIVGSLIGRQLLMPAVLTTLVYTMWSVGVLPSDRLILFVLMVETATPTAVALSTMSQLLKFNKDETAELLFWQMICAVFTMPLWCTVFLALLNTVQQAQ